MNTQPVLIFYKSFAPFTLSITVFLCFLFAREPAILMVINLFWTKVITTALALLYIHLFEKEKMYFFFNLGFTIKKLYLLCFFFDIVVWLLLMTLTAFVV